MQNNDSKNNKKLEKAYEKYAEFYNDDEESKDFENVSVIDANKFEEKDTNDKYYSEKNKETVERG